MLRATWVAQELLNTFHMEIGEITLIPSNDSIFEIRANDQPAWSLKGKERFPEPKEIKQRVRDEVAPGRSLGHAARQIIWRRHTSRRRRCQSVDS